jgi:hypothetical protein
LGTILKPSAVRQAKRKAWVFAYYRPRDFSGAVHGGKHVFASLIPAEISEARQLGGYQPSPSLNLAESGLIEINPIGCVDKIASLTFCGSVIWGG